METERGAVPGLSDKPSSQATPTTQEAGDASSAPPAGAPGKTVKVGLERAGVYVKYAVEKPARRWPVTAKAESSSSLRTSSSTRGASRWLPFSLQRASAWLSVCC